MPRRRLDGITCPICRKLVLPLDENGCMIEGYDMVTCRHYIGMAEDLGVPYMEKGFEDLQRLMGLLRYTVDYESDPSAVAATLASLLPDPQELVKWIADEGEVMLDVLLRSLPEVDASHNVWDGGAPGMSGTLTYMFASAPNQRRLVKRLAEICEAIERLPPRQDED